MKLRSKTLILATLVALSLMVVPAFSEPNTNGNHCYAPGANASGAACNSSGHPMIVKFMDKAGDRDMKFIAVRGDGKMDHGAMAGGMGMFDGPKGNFWVNASKNKSGPMDVPVHHSGSGFATSGSQFHVADLTVRGSFHLDPAKLAAVVDENKTLGKIKSDIQSELASEQSAGNYNGSLKIDDSRYLLRNVKLTASQGKNATVTADVAGPINVTGKHNATEFKEALKNAPVAGHLSLNIADHEKTLVGQGELTMNSGEYSGTYNLLINMEAGARKMGFDGRAMMGKPGMMGMGMGMGMGMPCNKDMGNPGMAGGCPGACGAGEHKDKQ